MPNFSVNDSANPLVGEMSVQSTQITTQLSKGAKKKSTSLTLLKIL